MPSGLVEHHHGVLAGCNRLSEFIEIDLHRVRRYLGHDQCEGIVRARLDGAEDVGERVALIGPARRTLAAREPTMADTALLPDAGFVLEKQADLLVRMCISNRFQAFTEPP